ncbi:hypothetical protein KRX54_05355 [Actinomycetaceae bacterium TAE3-ERU4]|nr:hypothetical protein [Actinomycetaceae bacterium TAE3-ERU4]
MSQELKEVSIELLMACLSADTIPNVSDGEGSVLAVAFPANLAFTPDSSGNIVVSGRWYRTLCGTYSGKAKMACATFNANSAGPSAMTNTLDNGQIQIVGRKLIWAHPGLTDLQLRSSVHDAINQFKDLSNFLDEEFPDTWQQEKTND